MAKVLAEGDEKEGIITYNEVLKEIDNNAYLHVVRKLFDSSEEIESSLTTEREFENSLSQSILKCANKDGKKPEDCSLKIKRSHDRFTDSYRILYLIEIISKSAADIHVSFWKPPTEIEERGKPKRPIQNYSHYKMKINEDDDPIEVKLIWYANLEIDLHGNKPREHIYLSFEPDIRIDTDIILNCIIELINKKLKEISIDPSLLSEVTFKQLKGKKERALEPSDDSLDKKLSSLYPSLSTGSNNSTGSEEQLSREEIKKIVQRPTVATTRKTKTKIKIQPSINELLDSAIEEANKERRQVDLLPTETEKVEEEEEEEEVKKDVEERLKTPYIYYKLDDQSKMKLDDILKNWNTYFYNKDGFKHVMFFKKDDGNDIFFSKVFYSYLQVFLEEVEGIQTEIKGSNKSKNPTFLEQLSKYIEMFKNEMKNGGVIKFTQFSFFAKQLAIIYYNCFFHKTENRLLRKNEIEDERSSYNAYVSLFNIFNKITHENLIMLISTYITLLDTCIEYSSPELSVEDLLKCENVKLTTEGESFITLIKLMIDKRVNVNQNLRDIFVFLTFLHIFTLIENGENYIYLNGSRKEIGKGPLEKIINLFYLMMGMGLNTKTQMSNEKFNTLLKNHTEQLASRVNPDLTIKMPRIGPLLNYFDYINVLELTKKRIEDLKIEITNLKINPLSGGKIKRRRTKKIRKVLKKTRKYKKNKKNIKSYKKKRI
jgi:hypothetical protein